MQSPVDLRSQRPAILLVVVMLTGCTATVPEDASNQMVVIMDASGSYRGRQAEAIERVTALMDAIEGERLHRWEEGTDRITVISLDASPGVLWEGSVRDLKAVDPDGWRRRFQARTDYAGCTDVTAAFNLALAKLDGDPRTTRRYLFVFSDLLHEPPTVSMRACARVVKVPESGFPWASLKGISTTVFWMPPDQKLLWSRAAAENGVPEIAFHTVSESGEVVLTPPAAPEIERTADEIAEGQARVTRILRRVGFGVLVAVLVPLILVVAAVALLKRKQSR